jgi:hypothetical protein
MATRLQHLRARRWRPGDQSGIHFSAGIQNYLQSLFQEQDGDSNFSILEIPGSIL